MPKCIVVAWFVLAVFAGPASAANEPQLTFPTGTVLSIGSKVRGSNVGNLVMKSEAGDFTCTYGGLTGTLRKNSGTELEWDLETAAFSGTEPNDQCASPYVPVDMKWTGTNGLPWCVRSTPAMAEGEVQIRGGACSGSAKAMRLSLNMTGCLFEANELPGTFVTHPNSALLTSEAALNLVIGPIALACGSKVEISSSYALESSKNPLYISGGPGLTFPTGSLLEPESAFQGNLAGKFALESAITTYCNSSTFGATVAGNSGTSFEADIDSYSFSECGSGNTLEVKGLPWCLGSTSGDGYRIRGADCSSAEQPVRFLLDGSGLSFGCSYERSSVSPMAGTYTTHPTDAVLSFTGQEFAKAAGPFGCPESIKLDGSFTFERDNTPETAPLIIS